MILGYEPSKVKSKFSIADYSSCSFNLGMSPDQFLEDLNPMYEAGLEQLKPYTTELDEFESSRSQILLINNSSEPFMPEQKNWLGVLHSATIINDDSRSRVINSMGVAPASLISHDDELATMLPEFLSSDAISGSYG